MPPYTRSNSSAYPNKFSESISMLKTQPKSAQRTPSDVPSGPRTPSAPATMNTSFFNDILSGFSLGVGSSLGHRVVNAVFGNPTVSVTHASPTPDDPCDPCDREHRKYVECMNQIHDAGSTIPLASTTCYNEHISFYECNRRNGSERSTPT